MALYIGTSGWSYDHWEGVLYPPGLPKVRRLEAYLQHFRTTELNASFYRWPGVKSFESWQRRLPPDFRLTVKAPRALTHAKRLYAPEEWLARIQNSLQILGDKLGVFLVQTPPNLAYDEARLAYFLRSLPPRLLTAFEFRHPTWHQEATFALLEQYGAAYCVMSGAGLPCILRVTARFAYVRLHGPDSHHLYAGSYSEADLQWWADRIREWAQGGLDVYAYFNNDGWGHAVRNAARLRQLLEDI